MWGALPPPPTAPRGCRGHSLSSCQRSRGWCRGARPGMWALASAGIVIPAEAGQGALPPVDPRRDGARHGCAGQVGSQGTLSPAPPGEGATGDSPPLHSPTRVWRYCRRTGVSALCGGWRRDCHPGGSRTGGCRPLSTPAGKGPGTAVPGKLTVWAGGQLLPYGKRMVGMRLRRSTRPTFRGWVAAGDGVA